MLYKKKIIFHNLFNINYISRFSGKLSSDKSSIVLIRDSDKCRYCSFNSLAGLECHRWYLIPKKSCTGITLYNFCREIEKESISNLKYRVKSIL